ncbi:Voltage-gated hydrogen channel 1 [Schistosoma japonicum]|nr:Voltage-gated hydrogen channel 1 [Schistosoma japonicum]
MLFCLFFNRNIYLPSKIYSKKWEFQVILYANANQCYTKEQTNNALKSIAALTTGFMGGLVGAPSHVQDVISKYGKNQFSSAQNFTHSTLKQSESLNTISKYQRQSVPRLVHIQLPKSKQSQNHHMCSNCEKHTNYSFEDRDHISDETKLPSTAQPTNDDDINLNNLFKRPRAFSLNPQEHWNSLQEKQFQSLLLQSESTTKLTKSLQPMENLDNADMLHEKSEKSTTSIFVRHTSEDTLNENLTTYYFVDSFRGHHFLKTIPNILKKALNKRKHRTNILQEEGEINEHINSTEEKQGKKYPSHGKEHFQRTNSSYPRTQTNSTVKEVLEIDDLSPIYNLSASNECMNSPKEVIYMKENQTDSHINENYLTTSFVSQSLDETFCRLTDVNDNNSDNFTKQHIKPTHGINNNVNNIHNKLITNRKESDEQIWILQPGYIWCQNENQAKLSTKKNKYSPSQSPCKEKSRTNKIKQLFSRCKTVHKDPKMLWSKSQLTNS